MWGIIEVESYRHITTHIASHIHIVTHARFSTFTYGTPVQPRSGAQNLFYEHTLTNKV